jgi:hypothetical protein
MTFCHHTPQGGFAKLMMAIAGTQRVYVLHK